MIWLGAAILFFIGFFLLFLEIFIIPGFGVFGISAILVLTGAGAFGYFYLGLTGALICAGIGLGLAISATPLAKKLGVLKHFTLDTILGKDTDQLEDDESKLILSSLIGKTGVSDSMLRPSGIAIIDGNKVDVMTEGVFLNKDTPIKVIKVEGNKVIVRHHIRN